MGVAMTVSTGRLKIALALFGLPAESVNSPPPTLTVAAVVLDKSGVSVAVYVVPLPEKLLNVPPVTVMSATVKSVAALLSVKVRSAP